MNSLTVRLFSVSLVVAVYRLSYTFYFWFWSIRLLILVVFWTIDDETLFIEDQTSFEKFVAELAEAKRRWKTMKQEKRQECMRRAAIIKEMITEIDARGRLGDKRRKAILQDLGVVPQSLYNWVKRCRKHLRLFAQEPLHYALVQRSGFPPKNIFKSPGLTEDEAAERQLMAIGAYLFGDWQVIFPNGNVKRSRDRAQAAVILDLLRKTYPDISITEDQLMRFYRRCMAEEHTLFVLGREGSKKLWREFVPKTHTDFPHPMSVVESDGRKLPIYVKFKIGKKIYKATVWLTVIVDGYSLRILAWDLVARVENDKGHLKKNDFREEDIRTLIATAFLETKERWLVWYTDNGSQFKAVAPYLSWLTRPDEPPITPIYGFPGHPWGRGKVEVVQKLIDSKLRKSAGFVRDEDDRDEWKRAREAADIEFDDLRSAVAAWVEHWNNRASCMKRWSKQRPVLLAPSEDTLAHFVAAHRMGMAGISDQGILIDKVYYKLKADPSAESYKRWMDAISGGAVRYFIIPRQPNALVIASLDGVHFEEIIPADEEIPSAKTRVRNQWDAVKLVQTRLQEVRKAYIELVSKKHGGMPMLDFIEDEVVLPAEVELRQQEKRRVQEVADLVGQVSENQGLTQNATDVPHKGTEEKPQKKRRGRPKGSANQTKTAPAIPVTLGLFSGINLSQDPLEEDHSTKG